MAEPVTIRLSEPIQFGSERIEEIVMKPNGRSLQGFQVKMGGDGSVVFEPYAFAKVGVHMAAKPYAILDLMHPADVTRIGLEVLGFTLRGPETGPAPSQ